MRRMAGCCAVLACWVLSDVFASDGPRTNPDDQVRGFWLLDAKCYDTLVDAGFNTFIIQYDEKTYGAGDYSRVVRARQEWLDRTMRDGTDYIEQFVVQQHTALKQDRYMCVSPEGTVDNPRMMDATNPELASTLRGRTQALADTLPTNPPASFVGVQSASEVRGHARPSFTPAFRERWRQASGGQEIPTGCVGKYGPNWRGVPGFPASRIVPDDHPVLVFYRWFYRGGDGWNGFLNDVADLSERRLGRPIVKMYDPIVRQPALRGFGAGMTLWNQWHYPTPEPYNVSYIISELQAMNRTNPDRQLAMMVQGISYRKVLAPKDVTVANPPAWLASRPNVTYMTTPPDVTCEALWTLFTRRLDGVMLYAWRALFDMPDATHPKDAEGYQFTNGETLPAVADLMTRVGVPLGPLFKAIPERPMEVAVLESFASAIFAQRCDMAFAGPTLDLGTMLTAANLMPQVLYEEDLAAGGVPESVRVLVLSQCEVLTEPAARAIRAFRARGGVILGDKYLAPGVAADLEVPSIVRTGKAADEQRQMRAGAAKLLRDLAPYYEPPVAASTPDVRAYVRSYRKTDFLFAVNDRRTAGDYVGQWGRVFEKGMPVEGQVTLRKSAGAVYDLVAHRAVPFTVENGVTRVPVSLKAADGRVFLLAEKPLAPLKAETDGRTVRVTTPDVTAMIPIGLFADGVKPRYGVVRGGSYRGAYAGRNVRVVNLADGSTVSASGGPRSVAAGISGGPRSVAAGTADTEVGPPVGIDPFPRRIYNRRAPSTNHPALSTALPPSQDPGFDHDLAEVLKLTVANGRIVLSAKPKCDAVELRFGGLRRAVRVSVNGVPAAAFDPSDARDANREFRFEADRFLKWNGTNEIKVADPDGKPVPCVCEVHVLRII